MQVSERKNLTVDAKTMPDILALLNPIVESLTVRFPGDGLWGQGWMERGGKEGDYLHN